MRVPHPRRRPAEIETLQQFDRRVSGAASLEGWVLQDLDLRGRTEVLLGRDPRGAVFLGCLLQPAAEEGLRARGALVFPPLPDVPFDAYRARLYSPEELYDGLADDLAPGLAPELADDLAPDRSRGRYDATLDARVHAWSRRHDDLTGHLARTLHDLAVDDALREVVHGRRVVGVMGGHATSRGSQDYRDAALLGRSLAAAGFTVATGGGPGAMEAANLGAYLAAHDEAALDEALTVLAEVPTFTPSVDAWVSAAFDVRRRWPDGGTSLGVPTWFYGHEPPNAFAQQIAKYFKNAIREDVLLAVAHAGTVFLPGRGGTVQEVFQDACENYYAEAGAVAPMVLVGRDYWTRSLPVWPLLEALAADRPMSGMLHLVDDPAEVPALLQR